MLITKRPGRTRTVLYPESAVILHALQECRDESEVFRICEQHRYQFLTKHFTAAFEVAARLCSPKVRTMRPEQRRNVQSLIEWLAKEAIFDMHNFDAGDCAGVVCALGGL